MLILLKALKFQRNSDDLERFARLHEKQSEVKSASLSVCVFDTERCMRVFTALDLDFCAFLPTFLLFL